eukprot:TRINITY_DN4027_c0_g1_i1.p1 TRINITY_DN4027_c0_g1~~TRINITY_DN4027_c0_g1_i1.p1  ORF type:complete len:367 (+),score=45.25 TRINITY_DN4027_c0_g1_i1:45-1145(+)
MLRNILGQAYRRTGAYVARASSVFMRQAPSARSLMNERTEYDTLFSFNKAKIHKRHGGGGGGGGSSGGSSSSGSGFSNRSPIFVRTSNNENRQEDPETVKQGNRVFWTLFSAMAAFMVYNMITATPVEDQRERAKKANDFLKQNPPKRSRLSAEEQINLQERRLRAWKIADLDLGQAESVGAKVRVDYRINDVPDGSQIEIKKTNGDVSFQSNYPLIPVTTNDYFEVTVDNKPADSVAAVGIATKPYPAFRLPGWDQMSVGYHGDDGHKFVNNNEGGDPYGPTFGERDVVGCGIECRGEEQEDCAVYFTLNGLRLDNATNRLNHVEYGYFPTVGCFGACTLTVNFGQTPFRYYKRRSSSYNDENQL